MSKKGLPYTKDQGFRVPENYFEDFETRLMGKFPSLKEDSLLPGNSSPYKVPDHYFEEFQSRLPDRLHLKTKQPKVISLTTKKHLSYIAGVAAVLAIILSSVILNRPHTFGYSDLDIVAVENYLLESLEFSSPEETHLLQEGDFSFATSPGKELDREALLEYLNDNIEDPTLLLNEQ